MRPSWETIIKAGPALADSRSIDLFLAIHQKINAHKQHTKGVQQFILSFHQSASRRTQSLTYKSFSKSGKPILVHASYLQSLPSPDVPKSSCNDKKRFVGDEYNRHKENERPGWGFGGVNKQTK